MTMEEPAPGLKGGGLGAELGFEGGKMGTTTKRILLMGRPSPLIEGVVDLLQLAGYEVALSPSWPEAEAASGGARPDLAIWDLSDWLDSLELPQLIEAAAPPDDIPLLLVSFSGDDRIWHLEPGADVRRGGRVQFYAHSLLGAGALLDKVRDCLD